MAFVTLHLFSDVSVVNLVLFRDRKRNLVTDVSVWRERVWRVGALVPYVV